MIINSVEGKKHGCESLKDSNKTPGVMFQRIWCQHKTGKQTDNSWGTRGNQCWEGCQYNVNSE